MKKDRVVCGDCAWIKWPVYSRRWAIDRLRRASEAGFIPMLKEADTLRRRVCWCSREGCWVHLLDHACSLWEPAAGDRET